MSCGVRSRHGSDPMLLWLWRRPAAVAPIPSLAWELPYATPAALKGKKRGGILRVELKSSNGQKKKIKKIKKNPSSSFILVSWKNYITNKGKRGKWDATKMLSLFRNW